MLARVCGGRASPRPLEPTGDRRPRDAISGGRALPLRGAALAALPALAKKAESLHSSPLGLSIHPRHGLWHAYRGALLFAERLELPECRAEPSPCDECWDRPCLDACPVGAMTRSGYDVAACVEHVASPAGCSCLMQGCLARRACPAGREFRYVPAQAEFHMRAFVEARRRSDRRPDASESAVPPESIVLSP